MSFNSWRYKAAPRILHCKQELRHYDCSTLTKLRDHTPSYRQASSKTPQQSQLVRVLLSALKACSTSRDLQNGRKFHQDAINCGQHTNPFVSAALVNMYSKCGSLAEAQKAFDIVPVPDPVLWNSLILAYVDNGESELALQIFSRMQCQELHPTARTFVYVLMACTGVSEKENPSQAGGKPVKLQALEKGMAAHAQAESFGYDQDIFVASSLVNMYSKCGSLLDARRVFDRMESHDLIVWTALLLGYAETGEPELALKLHSEMRFEPDSPAFSAALVASGNLGNLESGRVIHAQICRRGGLENDPGAVATSSLMDFYVKCGATAAAQRVFDSVKSVKDIVVWNILLAGYSSQGDVELVSELFRGMQEEGLKPDGVSFLSFLNCCSHAGLVDRGKRCFSLMINSSSKFGIVPGVQHYTCMVDLLGRANRVDEAVEMVKSMPVPPNAATWRAVLSSCRVLQKQTSSGVAEAAFQSLSGHDEASSGYVLLSNVYGSEEEANS